MTDSLTRELCGVQVNAIQVSKFAVSRALPGLCGVPERPIPTGTHERERDARAGRPVEVVVMGMVFDALRGFVER